MRFVSLFSAAALSLVSCGDAPERPADTTPSSTAEDTLVKPRAPYPYKSYCFERVGQIGAGGNQDASRRGDECSVHGNGAGEANGEGRNIASLHFSAPSLEAAGLGHVSFSLYVGHGRPKFSTGTENVDHMRMIDLPDRIILGSDITNKHSFYIMTKPDMDKVREANPGVDFPGYEVASGILMIETAVDMPDDGGVPGKIEAGTQYVTGSFTISLIPKGSKGDQFGPTTFEFGTEVPWAYFK